MTEPETTSFSGFARLLGVKPSAVTALRHADRLVLTPDGKRVVIDASRERLAATADPGKVGVVARHARERAAKAGAIPSQQGERERDEAADVDDEPQASSGFQHWRERNERAKALAGERDNMIAEGKLMDANDVTAAVAAAATQLRVRMESLPDVLGPQVAALRDEDQVRTVLAEAIEHALEETARQFANLARQQRDD